MKIWTLIISGIVLLSLAAGCVAYVTPYLSLDLKSVYNMSDISVNYTYVCEDREQRCVYSLYNINNPSAILYNDDGIMPQTGTLLFTGLSEGNYILEFSIYSEQNGEYTLLKFLNESYEFTVDYP